MGETKATLEVNRLIYKVLSQKTLHALAAQYPNSHILETKGREDLDDLRKIQRLSTWCADVHALQDRCEYAPVYVRQEDWDKKRPDLKSFAELATIFAAKPTATTA